MELVHAMLHASPDNSLILGNHEEYFLRVLDCNEESQDAADDWIKHGGYQTLDSYGLAESRDIGHLTDEFTRRFPHHFAMMKNAKDLIVEGNFAFVHAGVRPTVPLNEQKTVDLRWIRDEFLNYTGAHEKIIVHGHTITASRRPEIRSNRIALDTGAYATGILSALAIFFQHDTQQTSFLNTSS